MPRVTGPVYARMNDSAVATKTTYREAVREGLREALRADPRVFLMGEDVGHYGGCFAVSRGLLEEFGAERVRDTPLAEIPTAELDPKDRLARWQRKLLDLSLRNVLLNFRQGKSALLLEVGAAALEDALAAGQSIKLLPSPELMVGQDPCS